MSGARRYTGGCACGAVHIELVGEPLKVGLCHCGDCRKATGSAFLFYGDWANGSYSVSGPTATWEGRSFCPTCGSRLFHLGEDGIEINLGALDDAPLGLVPTREGWICRREPWQRAVDGAYQAERDPPREA